MSTSVKHFRYNMTGAPVLNGTAGSMIGLLDACLVNGFNLKTADSVVVTDNIATVTVSAGHGYANETVVLVAGATPAGLNGEKRVISSTSTTFTFDATGISNQTATGTVTMRVAPMGWAKVFSGTNLAVYRASDAQGTRMYLRVDDTNANNARVVAYESMTDVNTGTQPFPTAAQMSGGFYWNKASDTSATARGWELFGDSRTFYIHTNTSTASNIEGGHPHGFGDFLSTKSGDAYSCFLNGAITANHTGSSPQGESLTYSRRQDQTTYGTVCARSFTGLGSSTALHRVALSGLGNGDTFSGSAGYTYPNGPNNGLLMVRLQLNESTNARGFLRGMYFVPHNCHSSFSAGSHLDGQDDLDGRRLAVLKANGPNTTSSASMGLIDITGPWE